MAYRKQKPDVKALQRGQDWIDTNRQKLLHLGLPPIVMLDFAHWLDFLDNGCIDHHEDATRFSVDQLNAAQIGALRHFLEVEYSDGEHAPALLRWLRQRNENEKQK